jgi:hypothetical protein
VELYYLTSLDEYLLFNGILHIAWLLLFSETEVMDILSLRANKPKVLNKMSKVMYENALGE